MAKVCKICGKKPVRANNVSHSNKKTPRRQYPNLQKTKIEIKGNKKQVYVCTRCLRTLDKKVA